LELADSIKLPALFFVFMVIDFSAIGFKGVGFVCGSLVGVNAACLLPEAGGWLSPVKINLRFT
jgi:hypothetical protein